MSEHTMKVRVRNLGKLKQAEFEVGNLTTICGHNNIGKTYITHALFGFLSLWRSVVRFTIPEKKIGQLLKDGAISLNLLDYLGSYPEVLARACQEYSSDLLPTVFSAGVDRFRDATFEVELLISESEIIGRDYERRLGSVNSLMEIFALQKKSGDPSLVITFLTDAGNIGSQNELIKDLINQAIIEVIFGHRFPNPFIASADRAGIVTFRNDLNLTGKPMLLNKFPGETDPTESVFKDYPLPIKTNINFMYKLWSISKHKSQLSEERPKILTDFYKIVGGEYLITDNDELYLVKNKKLRLTMNESSSAVRSLLHIGFYLKHIAKKGDLLMIDEPELNLDIENQHLIARLLATLIDYGIKVFIVTHSYVIINTLADYCGETVGLSQQNLYTPVKSCRVGSLTKETG